MMYVRFILPAWIVCWLLSAGPPGRAGAQDKTPAAVASRTVIATNPQIASNGPSTSEELLAQSLDRLHRYRSVSTKLRYRAELFDLRMIGSGFYLQGPATSQMFRLEMKMQVDDQATSLQQICDGHQMWIHRRLGDLSSLDRVDLERMDAAKVEQGGAVHPGLQTLLAVGGLPRLMRGLHESFQFSAPMLTQLGATPVYALRGSWRPAALARLLPEQRAALDAGQPVDWNRVAAEVPDETILLVGRDDLFPYHLEYRRTSDRSAKQPTSTILLMMEWFDVQCNTPIEPRVFQYQSGDLPVNDATAAYMERLKP